MPVIWMLGRRSCPVRGGRLCDYGKQVDDYGRRLLGPLCNGSRFRRGGSRLVVDWLVGHRPLPGSSRFRRFGSGLVADFSRGGFQDITSTAPFAFALHQAQVGQPGEVPHWVWAMKIVSGYKDPCEKPLSPPRRFRHSAVTLTLKD